MPDPTPPTVEGAVVNGIETTPPSKANKKSEAKKKGKVSKDAASASQLSPPNPFHPPLHQISAFMFWWGYEIFVPQECMGRLDQVQNVSNSFLGFLQVVASASPITPYFGFISAWVGLQFTVIKAQNTGHGVVLAATWVLPVALVPRPWVPPKDE